MSVSFNVIRFQECIRANEGGSTFLGYLTGELVIQTADGDELKIGMPELRVRVTASGNERVEPPTDVVEIDGVEKHVARYWPASALSRELITNAVFQTAQVKRASKKALAA